MKWLPKFTFIIAVITMIIVTISKGVLAQPGIFGFTNSAYLRVTDTMLLFTIAIFLLLKES